MLFFPGKQFRDSLQPLDGLGLQRILNKYLRLDQEIFERLPRVEPLRAEQGKARCPCHGLFPGAGFCDPCVAALVSRDLKRLRICAVRPPLKQSHALLIPAVIGIDFHEFFERFAGARKLIVRQVQVE